MIKCQFESGNRASLRHAIVDCLVLKDDEIFLVKRAKKLLEGGKWALPGGFVNRDENLVQTVNREVREEAGYSIKDVKLLAIIDNPNRKNDERQNIAFVYFANADKKIGEGDWEVEDKKWFKLSDLPDEKDIAFDHLEFIELYKQHLANPFLLPVIK